MNEVLDICSQALGDNWQDFHRLAYYSHLIPVFLSMALSFLLILKAKKSNFSKIFITFTTLFSIWLIGDLVTWTSKNYYLVYTTWSFLDYIEIMFYVLGFYFAIIFVKKSDVTWFYKLALFLITIPALFITITQQSVAGFNYPVCEAFNNDFLGTYKLVVEGIILVMILVYAITPLFKKLPWKTKRVNLVVLGSMFLFLSTFGITEYLASVTGNYEMNLYSLFLLPIFLVAIIYSVFEFDIFNVKLIGSHYLVVGLVILMGGQLFFIENTTSRLLTILAILIAVSLSIILFRNLKRESDQRVQIEKLNINLQNLIKQRESLVHLVTHKIKGSFTRTKYIFAGILDGTFGEISEEVKKRAAQGLESDTTGIQTVDLVLNAANLQKGAVKYEMKKIDFKEIILKTFADKKVQAEARGLVMESNIHDGKDDIYNVLGDVFWLKEAVNNLIDNSIKYTQTGKITIGLEDGNGKVKFSVKDTGIGISDEDKKNLFIEGGRGKDSVKMNVDSTGYGLYSVKLIIEAHKGKAWAESELGKGSTFYVELDAAV